MEMEMATTRSLILKNEKSFTKFAHYNCDPAGGENQNEIASMRGSSRLIRNLVIPKRKARLKNAKHLRRAKNKKAMNGQEH